MTRIVAFVMAGGEGVRLRPYTLEQPKPALPVAGGCRIIDFVLSNLAHSEIRRVLVLLQYKPQALLDHLARHWSGGGADGAFVEPVLPPPGGRFRGTADAVRQSLHRLDGSRPELVAVFAADHVVRIDVRQMAAFHVDHGADVTVAALPVPIEAAREFGIVNCDEDARIVGFDEKPACPRAIPGDPRHAYVSMGNYLFSPEVLRDALDAAARRGEHDFGRHVLPRLVDSHRVFAYDFRRNRIPGLEAYEEHGYWRDVGTLDGYHAAQRDLLGACPLLRVDNPRWPIGLGAMRPARRDGVVRQEPARPAPASAVGEEAAAAP